MQYTNWAEPWSWHHGNIRASHLLLLCPQPHLPFLSPETKEKAGFLSKHRAAVLNLRSLVGIQGVDGRFEITCRFCAYTFTVHFSGESIHCFVTDSNPSLMCKEFKNHCISLWTEVHNKAQTVTLWGLDLYTRVSSERLLWPKEWKFGLPEHKRKKHTDAAMGKGKPAPLL